MTKQWKCYAKKPKRIRNAKDLLKFVQLIPETLWCVDIRDNGQGQRCVLGHLDGAYGSCEGNTNGFTLNELAVANNGVVGPFANTTPRIEGVKLDGKSIKSRVVNFIKANIDR